MAGSETAAERASKLMGGPSVLRQVIKSRLDFLSVVRAGLPWRAFELVTQRVAIEEITSWLRLSPRTIARRKEANRLDAEESERLLRLATVWTRACDVFGNEPKARAWLQATNRTLRGERPISLLDTDIGTQAVEDELVRIEYGVLT
jgi:putative toxin-antitoxin system antitoxin component (TIGR02293 family)